MRFTTISGPIEVNLANWKALEMAVRTRLDQRSGFALATLNLDHLVKLRRDRRFAEAYRCHDLVTADGNPVVWTCNLSGQEVDLLPGADCILPLAGIAHDMGVGIALLGSTEGTLEGAARTIRDHVPGIEILRSIAPEMGYDPMGEAAAGHLAQLQSDGVGLCFLALGAPKQEILAIRGREIAPSVGFVSIGAGLDFLAGRQARAPRWVRRLALEWVWRLASDPRRLLGRYVRSAAILPGLLIRAMLQRGRRQSS